MSAKETKYRLKLDETNRKAPNLIGSEPYSYINMFCGLLYLSLRLL